MVYFILFIMSMLTGPTCLAEDSTNITTSWKWKPQDEHPCNIPRLSRQDLFHKFGSHGLIPPLYAHPVIILRSQESDEANKEFYDLTKRNALMNFFGNDFLVTLSSSNSFSEHLRTIPLSKYLEEIDEIGETFPDQGSNETWYMFGRTYSERWHDLLDHYQLPPCRTCIPELVALSFGVGNRGSGVQWHTHGPGFSEALHGRKHWVLYPPNQEPRYHKDESSRQWMEYYYGTASPRPWECTLDPGDMIYFPDRWWHCTLNLDLYTAFLSTFTTEHDMPFYDEL